jgi:Skp family chaperone for outer membrane proteins
MIELDEDGKRLEQAKADRDAKKEAWIADETKAGRSKALWLAAVEEVDRAQRQGEEAIARERGETFEELVEACRRAKERVSRRRNIPRGEKIDA